jgi:hypothetical protein
MMEVEGTPSKKRGRTTKDAPAAKKIKLGKRRKTLLSEVKICTTLQ